MADVVQPCDVCSMLDADTTPKEVRYCSLCSAWMCQACFDDGTRRARAAGLRAKARLVRGMHGLLKGLGVRSDD